MSESRRDCLSGDSQVGAEFVEEGFEVGDFGFELGDALGEGEGCGGGGETCWGTAARGAGGAG